MSSQRRTTLTSRRRSSGTGQRRLGAVKLQSPLAGEGGAAARSVQGSAAAVSLSPLGSQAVESAASQVVHKALRVITDHAPVQQRAAGPASPFKPGFDSQSFLDKGMDAISGVGKLMEGFAITLDTVIGQAFEEWATPLQPGRAAKPRRPAAAPFAAGQAWPAGSTAAADPAPAGPPAPPGIPAAARGLSSSGQGPSLGAAGGKENLGVAGQARGRQQGAAPSRQQPHITSFMGKLDAASEQEVAEWRRRARQLASELQHVRAQQEEYQRLRLQYDKLQADLQRTSSAASRLAQENSALKSRASDPAAGEVDPVAAQQVACQMEALLLEKSKLVQENDRLLRENNGLQELLEFTVQHQAQLAGDGELFGYEEGDLLAGGGAISDAASDEEEDAQGACAAGEVPHLTAPPTVV